MITRDTRVPSQRERLAVFRYRWALIHGHQFNPAFPAGRLPRPAQPHKEPQ